MRRAVLIELSSTPERVLERLHQIDPVRYATGGVLVKGGPCWLAALVAHELGHPARWVAVWSPKDGAFRVVSRHHPEAPSEGTLVEENEVVITDRLVL